MANEKITASEAEQFVCAYWELVAVYWNPSIPDRFRIEMVDTRNMVEEEITHCGLPKTDAAMTEQRAWLAAYQFTLAHQQKIADVEAETRYVNSMPRRFQTPAPEVQERLLARLEAIRAELRRGVKE